MKISLSMAAKMATYIAKNKMSPKPEWQVTVKVQEDAGNPFRIVHGSAPSSVERQPHPMLNKRFPLVLMLEPLHACNLTCTGCGRIREYESTISQQLTIDQCLAASDECGAPMVSICGGEPMLYPKIGELCAKLLARGKQVILCTNGMFIRKKLAEFKPHENFYFNVHLDGMEKSHDLAVEREGVFNAAIDGIRAAKAAGFLVCTNTTVYNETDMSEIWQLFELLRELDVDTHQMAPAYGYSAVNDREIFMTRDDIREKFKDIQKFTNRFNLNHTPAYLDFLRGERELPCTAWGTPTYNIKGWKGPCYLITDAHYSTFEELMTKTQWENYGPGADPRCEHCMMHCGFEPSAALGINTRFSDTWKMLSWRCAEVKPVLVTGATGFLGWHVARKLLEKGWKVRALAREPARLREISVEPAQGDLRDPASLERAVSGCSVVFHVAADYRLWAKDPDELYRSNVDGTRNLLQAARNAGVERVVYTSTVGCIGMPAESLGDENQPVALEEMTGAYKRSKFLAEQTALGFAREGFPVVIVNPTAPVGDHDFKPTPTGRILVDFLRRKMPAYVDTGLNVVDARDTAEGHLLACERGRVGERYILGSENLTLQGIFERLARISGLKAPSVRIPYAVAFAVGAVNTAWANVTGREPRAPLDGVKMSRKKMWVTHAKAARELGFQPGSADVALHRAVEWFRANGYA